MAAGNLAVDPVMQLATIGVLGVGAQWVACRLRVPAIVLMLGIGLLAGPLLGVLDPKAALGDLMTPIISIAVAVILFEGGLTLNFHQLRDASHGVTRLVLVGAPLGWITSALALHYVAGVSWAVAAVFGGIMIVTGPTVIAPLLRQAKLSNRPAALLQWEAIVNDPIGALAAVLAYEVIVISVAAYTVGEAAVQLIIGLIVSSAAGVAGGYGIAQAFKRGWVPEYMKVPVLFFVLLGVFAGSNALLHESGLLAVTIMGVWIANANLPSYEELRRFKEHATVLLVSGVFVLLAASIDIGSIMALDLRALAFIAAIILLARPITVYLSLLGTKIPRSERTLVAFTGPRGVVLVAVAGLFGERLVALGIADGAMMAPLAFGLVAVTVVLHGFTLTPVARALGLSGGDAPGVLIVGGTSLGTQLGALLRDLDVPVVISDTNHRNLRSARDLGVPAFYDDVLSEAAEHMLEMHRYNYAIALSENEAYNTLVTTDLAPEFGRNNIFQLRRVREYSSRHELPSTLGVRPFLGDETYSSSLDKILLDLRMGVTRISTEYPLERFRHDRPEVVIAATLDDKAGLKLAPDLEKLTSADGMRILHFSPPLTADPYRQGAPNDTILH
jgi:NhaP-type Na+/H+ or K+/H+ antiporter